ncbi:MFS transporter [Streptomyces sp. NPDC018019]|uniref:MFS transporter n=1 Tax=Streptomyces sp. NPDC018019 TaxID=3365030 RepID=UPI003791692E
MNRRLPPAGGSGDDGAERGAAAGGHRAGDGGPHGPAEAGQDEGPNPAPAAAPGVRKNEDSTAGPTSTPAAVYRYLLLRTVGTLATETLQFAVPVLVYQSTGNLAWSGLALALEWLPRLVSLPLAGPLVDYFGVHRVYIVSDVVRGTAAVCVALTIALAGSTVVGAVVLFALVAGACFQQTFVANEKAVRVLVSGSAVPRAQSWLGAVDQTTLLAGPAVGAGLLTLGGGMAVFIAASALYAISLALVLLEHHLSDGTGTVARGGRETVVHEEGAAGGRPRWAAVLRTIRRRLAAGARRVRGDPVLRDVVLIAMVVNLMLGMVISCAPALVTHVYHRSGSQLGLAYTCAGAASLLVLLGTPWLARRHGLLTVGVGSTALACLAFAGLGAAPGFLAFGALLALFLCGDSALTVFVRTVRARVVPPHEYGSTVGVIVLLNFLPMPLAGALVAASRWILPLPALLAAVGGCCLAATILLGRRMARHRGAPW